MAFSGKKISFGFTKTTKTSSVKPATSQEKDEKQFIDCLDSKTIVCKSSENEEVEIDMGELVIPVNRDTDENARQEKKVISRADIIVGSSSIEQQAVKELLEDAKKAELSEKASSTLLMIQKAKQRESSLESTLDDYENVPVTEYGLAMLRGMGWKPDKGIGKTGRSVAPEMPQPHPRGLGLGASKVPTMPASQSKPTKDEEELKLVKGAYVQITSGSSRGQYGQVEGFNEDSGRVIMKLAMQGRVVTLNECAFRLVTKEDYNSNSRVLRLNRSAFDNKTVSFEEHIKCEHNMWHYLYFIVLVKVKDPTEFTGPESYVYAMVKDRDLDWFPRLRAMSLAADEGEGEQIELRTLQAQLEKTQTLVSTLSQQLTELKDQMTEQRKQKQRIGLLNSTSAYLHNIPAQ